jgi:hypothetical protein
MVSTWTLRRGYTITLFDVDPAQSETLVPCRTAVAFTHRRQLRAAGPCTRA